MRVLCLDCTIYGFSYAWSVTCFDCPMCGLSYVWIVLCLDSPTFGLSYVWNCLEYFESDTNSYHCLQNWLTFYSEAKLI